MSSVLCKSVKSKREQFLRCPKKCKEGSDFCCVHSKQAKQILYNESSLDPLFSENDVDPVSLEQIFREDEKGKRVMTSKCNLFTYIMESGGKRYQRTLQLSTLRDLFKNNIRKDPFSNQTLPDEVVARALREISNSSLPKRRNFTHTEEHNIRINNIIDQFRNIGYLIDPSYLSSNRKGFFMAWMNEANHLWMSFRRDNPDIAIHVYTNGSLPYVHQSLSTREALKAVTQNLIEFMSQSVMGVMIVLSALAWVSQDVQRAYPELVMV